MIIRIPLETLRELDPKFHGIFQRFADAGQIQGTVIAIERDKFDELNEGFFQGMRLGTMFHGAIKPVVEVIDKAVGTKLADCAGCVGRELKMNASMG